MKAQMRARKAENDLRKEDRTVRERFATDEEAFRHELFPAWVDRVDPHDKPRYRLGRFAIGPKFLPSFRSHPEDQRAKALKALVDLLTGRKELMDKRNPHVLRQGRGAEGPPQARARDGAAYWRMSVERNTAAARRVHYLKLPDGGLELHELVPHEVTQP
ncbi:hypothetical protein HER39_20200 [Arthrobacter deserti]|uniref:Uncharacterized protein n=1 Tax=Arthrobacter deserti TaxID=1742687 RepID=A0ABX1JU60_9MICC|nr:hypothetical protein [Arthrobacter deserti]